MSYKRVSNTKSGKKKKSASTLQSIPKPKKTALQKYFITYFDEKDIPYTSWDLTDKNGVSHFITPEVVQEFIIYGMSPTDQKSVRDMIVKIEFSNAPIIPFLKYIAQGMVDNYRGVLSGV